MGAIRKLTDKSEGGFYCIQTEGWVDTIVLGSAGTAEAYVFPTGAKVAFFSATSGFYAKFSSDATANPASLPVGDITDGTGAVLNPAGREIIENEVSLISPIDGTIITITIMG